MAHSGESRADVPSGRVLPYNFDLQPRKESSMAVHRGLPRVYVINNVTSWLRERSAFSLYLLFPYCLARSSSSPESSFPPPGAMGLLGPASPRSVRCGRGGEGSEDFVSGNAEGGRPWQGPTTTMRSHHASALAIDKYIARSYLVAKVDSARTLDI